MAKASLPAESCYCENWLIVTKSELTGTVQHGSATAYVISNTRAFPAGHSGICGKKLSVIICGSEFSGQGILVTVTDFLVSTQSPCQFCCSSECVY